MKRHAARPIRVRTRAIAVVGVLGLAGMGAATAAGASAPPDSSLPESSVPQSSAPESSAPESSTPESSAPESSVPESSAPESSVPESSVPPITIPVPDPSSTFQPQPIEWSTDAIAPGVDEGHLDVPIDYANPDAGSFHLYLARHRATGDRVGSLLVNPGGPGAGGSDFAIYADQVYDQPLLDSFDIIGWDPRGTGLSTPAIDCFDDYDHFFTGTDITPDDEAERQQIVDLAKEFADDCVAKNGDIMQFVGTNNSARDMDSIRKALGEDEISYFGFSYGSELGATWATMFPYTVRAAVLDGASDPNADALQLSLQQAKGFEDALTSFLADCSADPDCAFHHDGDAEGAFDRLMLKLDEKPIPSATGRPAVTRGVALQAVAEAMYDTPIGPCSRPPSPPPSRATAPACSRSTTATTSVGWTARGATSSRRSR